jgi:hypothetical protein
MATNLSPSSYSSLQETPNQTRFLRCLEMCGGSITVASRWAKVSRQAHYKWLDVDPAYKPKFEAAIRRGVTVLADEAIRRGREGVRKPVFYKGKIVGYVQEYSDTLLLRMMEAREAETYSQRVKQDHTGNVGVEVTGPVKVIVEYEDKPRP